MQHEYSLKRRKALSSRMHDLDKGVSRLRDLPTQDALEKHCAHSIRPHFEKISVREFTFNECRVSWQFPQWTASV